MENGTDADADLLPALDTPMDTEVRDTGQSQGLVLSRDIYTQHQYDEKYPRKAHHMIKPTFGERVKRHCTVANVIQALLGYIPIIGVIKRYKPKEYVLGDVLSGLTVSFLHLPMAMGFGILAGLRPIHGLYGTFFPVLIYMIFGTSTYISFGTNAVMALLTQTVVEREAGIFVSEMCAASNGTMPTEDEIMDVKVGTAMACCVISGVVLMVMGLLKMGVITTYLSVSFIGGFTTATAIHIASSQVPKMFGVKVQSFSGAFKLVFMYIDLFRNISETNIMEVIICVTCMVIILTVKVCINERFREKMPMPIPIDLLVVITATFISHFANINTSLDVKVVGPIPSGFQAPAAPRLQYAGNFASDAVVMAILSLIMSISMAKLCAEKHRTSINDNQELLAYGLSNLVSGFFFAFPSATAPPRMMILSTLGAKSTLHAITTSLFMLLVILVIGQLFVSLPMCVLAAMIIISMKDLLLQYRQLPRIWRVNKYDFIIWAVTNAISVLVDLNYGIIAGVLISIYLVIIRDQTSRGELVTVSATEDIIVNAHTHQTIQSVSHPHSIRVFRIPTSFYFATAERIKAQIYKQVLNPTNVQVNTKKARTDKEVTYVPTAKTKASYDKASGDNAVDTDTVLLNVNVPADDAVLAMVLDWTRVTYIDMAGIAVLDVILLDFKLAGVSVYLTGINAAIMRTMTQADLFKRFDKSNVLFDVFDAIHFIRTGQQQH